MDKRLAGLIGGLALALAATPASAQSAPPIGMWRGEAAGDIILLQQNGSCSAQGSVNVGGSCSWNATSSGGVLTMTYQWVTGPANMYWNVTWIDQSTILVNSVERFHRVG